MTKLTSIHKDIKVDGICVSFVSERIFLKSGKEKKNEENVHNFQFIPRPTLYSHLSQIIPQETDLYKLHLDFILWLQIGFSQ